LPCNNNSVSASWRYGVKTAEIDELEKHAGYSCEFPEHAVVPLLSEEET
jgi:hypothetical protein